MFIDGIGTSFVGYRYPFCWGYFFEINVLKPIIYSCKKDLLISLELSTYN